jgi:hypothetical protein
VTIKGKHGSSDRSDAGGKKQRKTITPEEKLDVIWRYKQKEHMADGQCNGTPQRLLKGVRKQANKIKGSCKSVGMMARKIKQIGEIMKKLKGMLAQRIKQHQRAIPLTQSFRLKEKACLTT